jgi:DNA-binding NtrC family response regulator
MKSKILIIDDDAKICELLTLCFRQHQYDVVSATSSAEARKQIENDAPDLVICDFHLEDSDGLSLIDEIHKMLPDLPIVLLTGVIFDQRTLAETILKKVALYLPKTTPLLRIVEQVKLIRPASA